MTRSVVERWRFLPDMVPSASSRLPATSGRAPPPSSPAGVSSPGPVGPPCAGRCSSRWPSVLSLVLPGRPPYCENHDMTRSPKTAIIPYYFCLHHSKNLIPLPHLSPSIPQTSRILPSLWNGTS
ncbi:unnamed protein product [Nyctereutes procyonoides]|uniref:(raccoon dog) hypothetical protein n=1 Tax=Nyctereutes procyonoides TaxID=34880 RepID=A0A811ZDY0_NYCPR|nr:unnamed protein product [Nyctereutes procyonoides]